MSLITNRRCTSTNIDIDDIDNIDIDDIDHLLHSCTKFPKLRLDGIVGEGSFGIVFVGDTDPSGRNNKEVAVKITKTPLNEKDFEDLNYEITYSYNMGTLGLGPVLHDAFYIVNSQQNYKQVLIMDFYPYHGADALNMADDRTKKSIMKQMINLIKAMIFDHRMYCVDIKPQNFVVDGDLNKVKIIDFGNNWCIPQELMVDTEEDLFQILIFQLSILIKRYTNCDHDMVDSIFCRHFSDNFLKILNKNYDNPRLTTKFYVNKKLPQIKLEFLKSCKKESTPPRRSLRTRTSLKRTSPRPSPRR